MVKSLQRENGDWIAYKNQLQDLVVRYYVNLFSREMNSLRTTNLEGDFPFIPLDEWHTFNMDITKEEVYSALLDMASFKASGPMVSIQHFTNKCGVLLETISSISLRMPMTLVFFWMVSTLLTLIPKVNAPETIM